MVLYNISGLKVAMVCRYDTLKRRAEKYLSSDADTADITIEVTDRAVKNILLKYSGVSPASAELSLTAAGFSRQLPQFDGFILHASAIGYRGTAILFSADSGVGKSTHTRLWQNVFGKDNVPIINDDQPVIRFLSGKAFVYGSPFSGNSEENADIKLPLRAVVFLERAKTNDIHRLLPQDSVPLFLRQIPRYSYDRDYMDRILALLDRLLAHTPVWLLKCTPDRSAALLAEKAITSDSI